MEAQVRATSIYILICIFTACSHLHSLRSSGAYELLRSSSCLRLPSQRTLRDYTHYVKAAHGYSHEVDCMLVKAAKLDTCPDREKCVLLLLDEMHIREDIVFDRHSGAMIGFANLGEINEHLLRFERSMCSKDKPAASQDHARFYGQRTV